MGDNNSSTIIETVDNGLCVSFKCSLLPAGTVIEIVACALPLVFTSLIAYWIFHKSGWKFARLNYLVATYSNSLLNSRDPFQFERWAPWFIRLTKFTAFTPVMSAAFLGIMAWYLSKPYYFDERYPKMVGMSLFTGAIQILFGFFGFFHWQAEGYRLTRLSAGCFGIVAMALISLQLSLTYLILDTERAAFVMYMLYNLAPLLLNAHLNNYLGPTLKFHQFLLIKPAQAEFFEKIEQLKFKTKRFMLLNALLSFIALIVFASTVKSVYFSNFGFQVAAAVLYCDIGLGLMHAAGIHSTTLTILFISVTVRAVLFAFWIDGWFFAVSVNFLLLCGLIVYHIVDQNNPLLTKEEALDRAVGSLESVLETEKNKAETAARNKKSALAISAQTHSDSDSKRPGFGRLISSKVTDLTKNVTRIVDGSAVIDLFDSGVKKLHILQYPATALTVLLATYIVYTAIALYADRQQPTWYQETFPSVSLSSNGATHPQYQFGLFALMVFVCGTLFFWAFRVFEIAEFEWKRSVLIATIVFIIVTTVSCTLLGLLVSSDIIFVFGCYFPALLVCSIFLYTQWRKSDYYWNSWIITKRREWDTWNKNKKKQQKTLQTSPSTNLSSPLLSKSFDRSINANQNEENKESDNLLQKTEEEMGERPKNNLKWLLKSLVAFVRLQHSVTDYLIAISAFLCYLFGALIGVHMAQTSVGPDDSYLIAELIGLSILTIFALLKFFNTFSIGTGSTLAMFAILADTAVSIHQHGAPADASLALALLHPALVSVICSFYLWRAQNWKLSRSVTMGVFTGSVLVVVFILSYMALEKAWLTAIFALAGFVIAMFFVSLGMVWSSNEFHLPKKWAKFGAFGFGLFSLVAFALINYERVYWFWVFTFVCVLALILLTTFTVEELNENESKKLHTSAYIFPVFVYQPGLSSPKIEVNNKGLIGVYAIGFLLIIWGLIAGLLIDPQFVGWIVFALGCVVIIESSLTASFEPALRFWLAWNIVKQSPTLIEEARQTAIQSQLKRDDDLMTGQGLSSEHDFAVDSSAQTMAANSGQDSGASLDYLRFVKNYWSWEDKADVEMLREYRDQFLKNPYLPEFADLNIKDKTQLAFKTLMDMDQMISSAYEEQSRIVVAFELLLTVGAGAIQAKNRARIKDFIRNYDLKNPEAKIDNMSPLQITEWAKNHQEELQQAKAGYVGETMNGLLQQSQVAEEERKKAAERKLKLLEDKKKNFDLFGFESSRNYTVSNSDVQVNEEEDKEDEKTEPDSHDNTNNAPKALKHLKLPNLLR